MHLIQFCPLFFPLYLDPGSGSFIIQLLLAAILAAGVAVRIYWKKIIGLFKRKNTGQTDEFDEGGTSEDELK
jgi:hypothetical protein